VEYADAEGISCAEAKTRWAGPDLGQHTDEVLLHDLGMGEGELVKLREEGVVG